MIPLRDDNPTRRLPWITLALIAANVGAFIYSLGLDQASLAAFWTRWAVVPARLLADPLAPAQALTVFTAMFMHAGWLHIIGNMLYLWIFGNNIEDIMGPFRYIIFYLVCGLAAAVAQLLLWRGDPTIPMLGASGAIAGVLGAYLVRFPYAKVDSCLLLPFFATVVRLPALVVLAFWFVLQLLSGTISLVGTTQSGGGTAWWAHIGGFLAGMLLVMLFVRRGRNEGYPLR